MYLRQEVGIASFRGSSENQAQSDGIELAGARSEHVEEETEGEVGAPVAEAGGDGSVPCNSVMGGEDVEELKDVVYGLGFDGS